MASTERVKVSEWHGGGSMWISGTRAIKVWNENVLENAQREAKNWCQAMHTSPRPLPDVRYHRIDSVPSVGVLKLGHPRWRLFCFRMGNQYHMADILLNPANKEYIPAARRASVIRDQLLLEIQNASPKR